MTATIKVSTVAELSSALKTAHAGDTIALAPGTYSGILIKNTNFSSAVTITSQKAVAPAVLTSFDVNNSSGLTFSNLEYSTVGANTPDAFRIANSKNILLNKINLHGSLDSNPGNDVNGLYISGSSNVKVQNSQFSQLANALIELNNTNITITGSSFHDIRSDGIDNGGSSNVLITGNKFTSFYPVSSAQHPDAIQFWTTNTTASAHDITVTNNVITRGNGSQIQGIFFRDEVGTLPFQNVVISNNILTGTMYNGITVSGANKLKLSNNVVDGYSDMASWIRVESSTNVSMSQNAAQHYVFANNTKLTQTGSVVLDAITPKAGTTLAAILATNSPLGAAAISHTSSLTVALLQMSR